MNATATAAPAVIYQITEKNTGEIRYVGRTNQSLRDRLRMHRGKASFTKAKYKSKFHTWLNLNLQNVEISVLEFLADPEDAKAREAFWIKEFTHVDSLLKCLWKVSVIPGRGTNRNK